MQVKPLFIRRASLKCVGTHRNPTKVCTGNNWACSRSPCPPAGVPSYMSESLLPPLCLSLLASPYTTDRACDAAHRHQMRKGRAVTPLPLQNNPCPRIFPSRSTSPFLRALSLPSLVPLDALYLGRHRLATVAGFSGDHTSLGRHLSTARLRIYRSLRGSSGVSGGRC